MKKRSEKLSHKRSLRQFKITGKFIYRGKGTAKGSGHKAGEDWGDRKDIDPESKTRKYSKNSPSFDEGVYLSKSKRKAKTQALNKMKE